ncbi:MAG: hypothetical protein NTZ33_05850 [Bacteroidetes bacterium]|nr:hypothetical protein [Bacteroidota bacterium]
MKTSKILLGGLAGGVGFFFLGWIIYGMLLNSFTTANYNQCAARPMADMVWWAMIVSNLVYGLFLAIIFNWAKVEGIVAGVKTAAIIGFLMAVSMDLSYYSMSTTFLNFSAVIIDILAYTFMTVLVGIIIALVMGKRSV